MLHLYLELLWSHALLHRESHSLLPAMVNFLQACFQIFISDWLIQPSIRYLIGLKASIWKLFWVLSMIHEKRMTPVPSVILNGLIGTFPKQNVIYECHLWVEFVFCLQKWQFSNKNGIYRIKIAFSRKIRFLWNQFDVIYSSKLKISFKDIIFTCQKWHFPLKFVFFCS